MALPSTVTFGGFKLYLGDGATPTEAFTAPCSFKSRSLKMSKDTTDTVLTDCADADAVTWVIRDPVSKSAEISGEGVLDMASLATWRAFFDLATAKNCRIELPGTGANGGGYWMGAFHMTSFEVQGQKGPRVTISVKLDSSGSVAWTAAA